MKVKGLSVSEMDDLLRINCLLLSNLACARSRTEQGTSASDKEGKKTELSPMAAKERESKRVRQRSRT